MAIVDLKIVLQRRDAESYHVELSSTPPDSDAEVLAETPGVARFDRAALLGLEHDPEAYGVALTRALFETPDERFATPLVREYFVSARSIAEGQELPLRVRLMVGPSAPELHALRWETLRDPERGTPLLLGSRVRFSRYLASGDWRPVRLRPRASLRALAVIAAPSDIASYRLAEVNGSAELARVRDALADIPVAALSGGGTATLEGLVAALRDGLEGHEHFDILYLVAHGMLVDGEPWLLLEGPDGATARVPGAELARRVSELEAAPRLVFLASCESAGVTADGTPLGALGPLLARAGVPAVIAMQGTVRVDTASAFARSFFSQLQRDGQIDAAVGVARGEVRDAPDYWMPALFMRLRSGQIWYEPGFKGEQPMEKWPALLTRINDGKCTPILGELLAERLLGSTRELAQRWAGEYRFPLAPHQKSDLPYVAQFLSVNQDPEYPRDAFVRAMRQALLDRYKPDLPPTLATPRAPLPKLLAEVAKLRRARGLPDPYAPLAALPCSIYVTVAQDTLLEEALRAAGKEPQAEICRWNDDLATEPSVFDAGDYEPDEFKPLVFHLFGSVANPQSLVLTEDHYFDFLIGATRNRDLIPQPVKTALVDTALLFLGFRLEDWSFRVLYRSLMSAQGGKRLKRYANIAGQVLPEEGQFLAPEGAARYLEGYFKDANISIFWGSAEDFGEELQRRWEAMQQ